MDRRTKEGKDGEGDEREEWRLSKERSGRQKNIKSWSRSRKRETGHERN